MNGGGGLKGAHERGRTRANGVFHAGDSGAEAESGMERNSIEGPIQP